MKHCSQRHVVLALLALLALSLTSCSGERRQVIQYLEGLSKGVMPAVQQGQVVGALLNNTTAGNFVATWPLVRQNLDDLRTKVVAADQAVKQLTAPPAATSLQQLVTEDIGVLHDLCDKSIDVGNQMSNLGSGLRVLKKLHDLKPAIDDIKLLSARHVELNAKIQTELANLKKAEHLPAN